MPRSRRASFVTYGKLGSFVLYWKRKEEFVIGNITNFVKWNLVTYQLVSWILNLVVFGAPRGLRVCITLLCFFWVETRALGPKLWSRRVARQKTDWEEGDYGGLESHSTVHSTRSLPRHGYKRMAEGRFPDYSMANVCETVAAHDFLFVGPEKSLLGQPQEYMWCVGGRQWWHIRVK